MAAANFSRDVVEMFYGPVQREENRRLRTPVRPRRRLDFELARNNFKQWLRVWKMEVRRGQQRYLEIFPKD